ncbi:hypothetical protein QP445_11575, partial [Micrococcus luteus]|nr:hypothetical protein [Micrococcus luteus]
YEQQIDSGVQWFGGADSVSRAAITGLGADGNLSYLSFAMGKTLGNPPIYEWRKAAGYALIVGGFDNFKDLYNNQQDPVAWDIKQLKNEQALLQPIHEKYLSDKKGFTKASQLLTSEQMLKLNVFGSKQIIQDKQAVFVKRVVRYFMPLSSRFDVELADSLMG